jgi:hypothetical protein
LSIHPLEPPVFLQLSHHTDQNQRPGRPKPSPVGVRAHGVYRPTVRAPIPLHPQSLGSLVKEPIHIPMTPNSTSLTSRTTGYLRPRILFLVFRKALEIDWKMQYQ